MQRYTHMPVLAKPKSVVDAAFEKYYDVRARAAPSTGAVELTDEGTAVRSSGQFAMEIPLYLFDYWTSDGKGWRQCFTYRNMSEFYEKAWRDQVLDVSDQTDTFWLHNNYTTLLGIRKGEGYDFAAFSPISMDVEKGEAMIWHMRIANPEEMQTLVKEAREVMQTILTSHVSTLNN